MKLLYTILFGLVSLNVAHADDSALKCTSVLPFICAKPDCSDNKKIAALCDGGTLSFTEPGTECMKPRVPMAKCTRAAGTKPSVEQGDGPGIWYIAVLNGKTQVIKTPEEARAVFPTISDPHTAMGMALILTNEFPLFAAPYPTLNNGWCTDQTDPGTWLDRYAAVSSTTKVDRGYQIQLFTIAHVGKGDQLLAKTYVLSDTGEILEQAIAKKPLWICPSKKKK